MPTTSTSPTPTTPTASPTTAEDWTVPDPITDEYAQRVLQELYNIEFGVLELAAEQVRATGEVNVTPEMETIARSVRTSESATNLVSQLRGLTPSLIDAWADPASPYRVEAAEVTSSGADCLATVVTIDPTPLTPNAMVTHRGIVLESDAGANRTGWVIQTTVEPDVLPAC